MKLLQIINPLRTAPWDYIDITEFKGLINYIDEDFYEILNYLEVPCD